MAYRLDLSEVVYDGGDARLQPAISEAIIWIESISEFVFVKHIVNSSIPSEPSPFDSGYMLVNEGILSLDWSEIPNTSMVFLFYSCKDLPNCPAWGGATWGVVEWVSGRPVTLTTIAYSASWMFGKPRDVEPGVTTSLGTTFVHEFLNQVYGWTRKLGYTIKNTYELFDEGIGNTDATRYILDRAFFDQLTPEMYYDISGSSPISKFPITLGLGLVGGFLLLSKAKRRKDIDKRVPSMLVSRKR